MEHCKSCGKERDFEGVAWVSDHICSMSCWAVFKARWKIKLKEKVREAAREM